MGRADRRDDHDHRTLGGAAVSLRSPLGRVLGLGSAKEGTDHWWAQRLTAVALVLLGLWFLVSIVCLNSLTYLDTIQFIAHPFNSVMLVLLCVTLSYHSHLGVQVVIEDYVHTPAVKLTSLILSRFIHVFIGVSAVYAVVRVGIDT